MTEFGRWLGTENGTQMLSAVLDNCTKEQARAAVTTYCILFGIEVDTLQWDKLITWIWECYNSWFGEFDEMDMYMSELLV